MPFAFTQPITACQGCEDPYVAFGPSPEEEAGYTSGSEEVSET